MFRYVRQSCYSFYYFLKILSLCNSPFSAKTPERRCDSSARRGNISRATAPSTRCLYRWSYLRNYQRRIINFLERGATYRPPLPICETSISLVMPRNNSAGRRRKDTAARSRNAIAEERPPTEFTGFHHPRWKIGPPSDDITIYSRVMPDKSREQPLALGTPFSDTVDSSRKKGRPWHGVCVCVCTKGPPSILES